MSLHGPAAPITPARRRPDRHPGRVACPAGHRPGRGGGPVPAGTGVLVHRSTAITRLQSAYVDDKVRR